MVSNKAALPATRLQRQSTPPFPRVVARLIVVVMTMLLSLRDGDPRADKSYVITARRAPRFHRYARDIRIAMKFLR